MKYEASAKLTYNEDLYTPYALRSGALSPEQQRQEYARLRRIANKRLKSFEKNKKYLKSEAYLQNVNQYLQPATALTERELAYKLTAVAKFVKAKGGSVSGQTRIRKKAIETLNAHGVDFVTTKNFDDFVAYMEAYRENRETLAYDSDEVVQMFYKDLKAGKAEVKKTLKNFADRFLKFTENEAE